MDSITDNTLKKFYEMTIHITELLSVMKMSI